MSIESIARSVKLIQKYRRKQAALRFSKKVEAKKLLDIQEIVAGSEHKRKRMPAIYFLLKREAVVYVGQSKWVYDRVCQHLLNRSMKFDRYFILQCRATELMKLEARYIAKFQPIYNKNRRQNSGYLIRQIAPEVASALEQDGTV